MTTVSRASGGARISRQEKASRAWRDALVADAHGGRIDAERSRMTGDLPLDRRPGTRLEPRLQDSADRPTIRVGEVDHDLVGVRAADPLDGRPAPAGSGGDHAESMQVPPVPDGRAVAQPAACHDLRPVPCLAREVATKPRFTLGQEGVDMPLRIAPSAPSGGRHGHDDAAIGMDDDAQAPRARRAPERVRHRTAGQARDGRRLGGRRRRSLRESPSSHERRSDRPGRSPVSTPSRINRSNAVMPRW
jgi:hypothetical protein